MTDDSNKNDAEVCAKHGTKLKKAMRDGLRTWCHECLIETNERRNAEDKERLERERLAHQESRLYAVARLPNRFADCSFDNYDPLTPAHQAALTKCQDFVRSVCAGGDNSLILSGTVGTGKTHLGCAIANAVIARIIDSQSFDFGDVHYLTVPSLIDEARSTWGDYRASEVTVFDKYGHCCLLILDEAGIQRGSDDEHRILFGVINRRYENLLPTVVITNLAASNLDRAMGQRVVDRLRENGKAVTLDWPSYRKHDRVAARIT